METWDHREAEPSKNSSWSSPRPKRVLESALLLAYGNMRPSGGRAFAEPSSLFSNSWPRPGRLSEREQSQLVLDQVLNQACKSAPFYTNSDQSHLISDCRTWLTYIRWLDNGYNSEPDWYKLSLGVSGLVCVVILVYQSRLSVDPAGRTRLRRSSQPPASGFP